MGWTKSYLDLGVADENSKKLVTEIVHTHTQREWKLIVAHVISDLGCDVDIQRHEGRLYCIIFWGLILY